MVWYGMVWYGMVDVPLCDGYLSSIIILKVQFTDYSVALNVVDWYTKAGPAITFCLHQHLELGDTTKS